MTTQVWHYDGVSAVRRLPLIEVEGDRFRLSGTDEKFAFADLEPRDGQSGDAVFGLKKRPGWRIGFASNIPPEITALLPRAARYGGVIDRIGLLPSLAVFAVLAAIAITLFLRTPALVARAIPQSTERRLGDLMFGDLGGRTCNGGDGPAALATLVQRIDADDAAIDVRVVNLPVVNAVTLPGGRIVVFDGLLRAAKSPDELAGVLAHEIGHVKNRDVMESLLRQLGLSVLLGGLDGNVGGYTNALLASSYSRGAEGRADDFAIAMLRDASVSPIATADFFRRLGGKDGQAGRVEAALSYLASHPVSSGRAKAFAASAKGPYRPALDAGQWRALRSICPSDKDVEKPEFRF